MTIAATLRLATITVALLLIGSEASAQAHPKIKSIEPTAVWLEGTITVELEDAERWLQSAESKDLILYLDGHALPSVKARLYGEGSNKAMFQLTRDSASAAIWAELLSRPTFAGRQVRMQVGLPDRPPFAGEQKLQLLTLDSTWFWWAVGAFGVLLVAFFLLAWLTDLLREGAKTAAGDRRPFSLGRVQMAVFFFVVIASFIFIWITTGAYDPLTSSVLALLGISAGTAASAAIVDANKEMKVENRGSALSEERQKIETELKALEVRRADLQTAVNGAGAAPADEQKKQLTDAQATIAAKRERVAQIDQELASVAAQVQPAKSEGLITDLLSDANGVSFHRFQIVVWTMILVGIFIDTVYNSLKMPDFDPKLLALMGLSAGTYLGFKFPENK